MCKVKDNYRKIYEVEGFSIDRILDEYYDPETVPLSEEELEETLEKHGYDSDESVCDI
jgi:hypothetical protein